MLHHHDRDLILLSTLVSAHLLRAVGKGKCALRFPEE